MLVELPVSSAAASTLALTAIFIIIHLRLSKPSLKFPVLAILATLILPRYARLARYDLTGERAGMGMLLGAQALSVTLLPALSIHLASSLPPEGLRRLSRLVRIALYLLSGALAIDAYAGVVMPGDFCIHEEAGPIMTTCLLDIPAPLAVTVAVALLSVIACAILYTARHSQSSLTRTRLRRLAAALGMLTGYAALSALSLESFIAPGTSSLTGSSILFAADGLSVLAAASVFRTVTTSAGSRSEPLEPRARPHLGLDVALALVLAWACFRLDLSLVTQGYSLGLFVPPFTAGLVLGLLVVRVTASRVLPPDEPGPWRQTIDLQSALRRIRVGAIDGQAAGDAIRESLTSLMEHVSARALILARRAQTQPGGEMRFLPEVVVRQGELAVPDNEPVVVRRPPDEWPVLLSVPKRGRGKRISLFLPEDLQNLVACVFPVSVFNDLAGLLLVGRPAHSGPYKSEHLSLMWDFADAVSAAWTLGELEQRRRRWRAPRSVTGSPISPEPEARQGVKSTSAMMAVRVRMLGRFNVTVGDKSLEADPQVSRRALSLLALLIWAGEEGLPRERLMAYFWPDASPARARNALNVTIHHLRRALEPGIPEPRNSRLVPFSNGRYFFRKTKQVWIDVDDLVAYLQHTREALRDGDVQAALSHVRNALALYRGDLLQDLDLPGEVEQTRQRIRADLVHTCWRAIEAAEELGLEGEVEELLHGVIQVDPWELRAYRLLARLYRRNGRYGLARRMMRLLEERERDVTGNY